MVSASILTHTFDDMYTMSGDAFPDYLRSVVGIVTDLGQRLSLIGALPRSHSLTYIMYISCFIYIFPPGTERLLCGLPNIQAEVGNLFLN